MWTRHLQHAHGGVCGGGGVFRGFYGHIAGELTAVSIILGTRWSGKGSLVRCVVLWPAFRAAAVALVTTGSTSGGSGGRSAGFASVAFVSFPFFGEVRGTFPDVGDGSRCDGVGACGCEVHAGVNKGGL